MEDEELMHIHGDDPGPRGPRGTLFSLKFSEWTLEEVQWICKSHRGNCAKCEFHWKEDEKWCALKDVTPAYWDLERSQN